ncbi:MAG: SGNH/GDSL hydrolase family protein [Chthoniobacteraceae bacterium]
MLKISLLSTPARLFAKFAFLILAAMPCVAESPKAAEPTNAAEAAAKKAAEDAEIDAKYQALVAKLPPDQQAWERTLQEQLGNFYLPIHKREKVRGTSNAWDFVADDPKLPRVLLIGDSVSRGYTQAVRKDLAGKANVHRAPANCGPTASGLKNLDVWLGAGKWDLIHFNFGIHDRATAPDIYEKNLEELVTRLKATGAKLVWASTTPIPPDTKDGDKAPAAIVEKNKIAARVMQKNGVLIDDLYAWMLPDLAKFQNPKDVHFNGAGYERLAQRVARVIETALPPVPGVNPATVPVGKLENDGYGWEDRHDAVMKIKDSLKPEIVLIGDSITHFWGGEPDGGRMGNRGRESWAALFGDRKVLNLGFGWDRTQNVLKRIELGELDGLDPKFIMIHIGTNNLAVTPQHRTETNEQIAEGITTVVERAQAKCPHAQVILMAVFPRGQGATNPERERINAINRLLAPLGKKPRITFLDITDKWLGPDGAVSEELMPGRLHPNEKGYHVWADAMRPLVAKP